MTTDAHERLDAEHTKATLIDYSGSYQDWLEERIEALEQENEGLRQRLEE